VPIGDARPLGRAADFAGDSDFVQEIEHDKDGLRIVVTLEAPDRFDFYVYHIVELSFICVLRK